MCSSGLQSFTGSSADAMEGKGLEKGTLIFKSSSVESSGYSMFAT